MAAAAPRFAILDPAYTIYTGFDSRQAMDCARELELN